MAPTTSSASGPPPPPNPKFLTAQQTIENDKTFSGATIGNAIASYTPAEKTSFLNWYSSVTSYNAQQRTKKMMSTPPDNKAYQAALQGVKWDDDASVNSFYNNLYPGRQIVAQPVFLGIDGVWRYYLRPEMPTMDINNDLPANTKDHLLALQLRTLDKTASPFQYGVCLGTLATVGTNAQGQFSIADLQSQPFRIYTDVLTSDIWLVYTTLFLDSLGEEAQLTEKDNSWNYLPSPQNNRAQFKCMRLFKGAQGPWNISPTYAIFSSDALASVTNSMVVPWSADKSKVNQAVAAARTRSGAAPPAA